MRSPLRLSSHNEPGQEGWTCAPDVPPLAISPIKARLPFLTAHGRLPSRPSNRRVAMRAFIFPGQGSQSVGMGSALASASSAARILLQAVDEALGEELARLMAEGPEERLTLTENAQPAIMANSMAVLRVLEQEAGIKLGDAAAFVAGHSLGEYTALCAAGTFDVATTARLLKLRGRSMQQAVPVGDGA